MKTWGAFHYANNSEIMVGIEKGHFGFFSDLKFPGSPLKVVHLFRLEYLTKICHSSLDQAVLFPSKGVISKE